MGLRACRIVAVLALTAAGCAANQLEVESVPDPVGAVPAVRLRAHLDYNGDRATLPRFLAGAPSDDHSAPTVHYHTHVSYASGMWVSFFDNRRWVEVTAQGTLRLDRAAGDPKTLVEECVVTMKVPVRVFEPPTDEELRKRALLCVRDLFDEELGGGEAP